MNGTLSAFRFWSLLDCEALLWPVIKLLANQFDPLELLGRFVREGSRTAFTLRITQPYYQGEPSVGPGNQ